MPLGMQVGDFVLDGTQLSPEIRHTSPTQFSAHVYCGHTAGWIKMSLGTEVNLGPVDVLDVVPALLLKGAQPPFSAHFYCGTYGHPATFVVQKYDAHRPIGMSYGHPYRTTHVTYMGVIWNVVWVME